MKNQLPHRERIFANLIFGKRLANHVFGKRLASRIPKEPLQFIEKTNNPVKMGKERHFSKDK